MDNITHNSNWCPFCAGKSLCDTDDCELCFNNSFASSDRAKFWSGKNECAAREVFLNSHKKYWFVCDSEKCGREFEMTPNHVTGRQWCPLCKNKTESKLLAHLQLKYGDEYIIETQKKFDWCRSETNRCMPYDFFMPDINLLIEMDGPQHFKQISNWESPQDIKKRDDMKNASALSNGYSIVRLLQEDVLYDRNGWEDVLDEIINDISTSPDESRMITMYEGEILYDPKDRRLPLGGDE